MQSISIQLGTDADKMVWWAKNELHQFFQETYPIILFQVHYMQQGSSALRFSVVYDNEGRGVYESYHQVSLSLICDS